MHKIILNFVAAVLLLACGSPGQKNEPVTSASPAGEDTIQNNFAINALTEEEINNDWELLFDGKSMKGWRIYKGLQNNSWEVTGGTLHCKPFDDNGENHRSDLITESAFENFDLRFDWKISPQANTGVIYHVTEELQETYMTGPEYQIVDDDGYPGELVDTQLTSSVYHMYAPLPERKVNPVGEWNESRIVVRNNKAEHWLNGTKVLEYTIQSDDWKNRIASSKWKDFPHFGIPQKGHIALQDHRNEVWFRNLKIKTL